MKPLCRNRLTAAVFGVLTPFLLAGWLGSATAQTAAKAGSGVPTVEEAKALVRQHANDPNAYIVLGGTYRRVKQYDDALAAFRKAASLDPKSSTPHVSLGAVYMDMGRSADAEKEFKKAIALNPKDGTAHLNLGSYYN